VRSVDAGPTFPTPEGRLMHTETVFALTILVLCYAVVSGLVGRWCLAPALIFVCFGIALGRFGFGVIHEGAHSEGFSVLAQVALTVILFNQASRVNLDKVFRRGHLTLRLLLIGIPGSLVLGALVALLLLPVLPFWEAVCLAVIVAPTEVALIESLLVDRRIPENVRHALSTESGFYDGFALAALLAAMALASEQTTHKPGRWVWFAVRTEVISALVGVAIGVVGALLISRSRARGWMSNTWLQLAMPALALVCFEAGEQLHGSGFVTAFAGGLSFAWVSSRSAAGPMMTQVSEATGELLELVVFAIFGGFAVIPAWRDAGWRVVLFAVVALIVVRVVAVGIALVGSGVPTRSRLFMGWFGPRGIGTLVLGMLVIAQGELHQGALITRAVVVTVTISLVLHSLTTPWGIRLCAQHDSATDTAVCDDDSSQVSTAD
jgi:sodium/hydrogen antiporter